LSDRRGRWRLAIMNGKATRGRYKAEIIVGVEEFTMMKIEINTSTKMKMENEDKRIFVMKICGFIILIR
jgi:hypothetical protein